MSYIAGCRYQAAAFRSGQRGTRRSFVRMPATITLPVAGDESHIVFVRDISPTGMFFYSNLKPEKGSRLELILQYLNKGCVTRLHLTGIVRRVEDGQPGTAVGVALKFDRRHDEVPYRSSFC